MVAEDDDEASKTEEPSERKISKAKEEGDIAISQDAKSFIMLIGMLFIIWLVLPLMFKWFYTYSLKFVETPDTIPTDGRHIRLLLYDTVFTLMKILGIPFAILMILGIFASIAQTGFVFAPKKLEPNWNKLNIFAALPQFINMKKIVESLKGIIKITVIAFIGILVIRPYLEKVNLMPGWIELRDSVISMSGSLYEYDTHVPLMILGGGMGTNRVDREVSMSDVTPTLAHMLQIPVPNASTGTVLEEAIR